MRDLPPEHLAAPAATAALCIVLVAGARRGGEAFAGPARLVLATAILTGFAAEQIASGGSLLDVMGPWPVYIAVAGALGLALFLALEAAAHRYPPADA